MLFNNRANFKTDKGLLKMLLTIINNQLTKFRLLFILLLFTFYSSTAQDNYNFRHLSTGDGLSQSSVISIAQDHKGLLWFATRDGLNTYDGNKFTIFRNDPSDSTTISNNDVLELLVASSGDIWAGTYNGLNRFDYKKGQFYSYYNEKENLNSLSNNTIWSICEMKNGEIWVGTSEGLNILKNGSFQRLFHNPLDSKSISDNYILDIFQDKSGQIWIGTANGLNKMISDENGKYQFEQLNMPIGKSEDSQNMFCQVINEDSSGNLWVGTKRGLYQLHPESSKWQVFENSVKNNSISNNDIRSLSFDKSNILWVGTYNGLNKMEQPGEFTQILSDANKPRSLSKNTIKSTFVDANGSLWIGIYYGGVNMLDEANNNFINYTQLPAGNGLSYDVISSIVEGNEGQIYIGTEGGGINVLDEKSGSISSIKNGSNIKISSNNIKALNLIFDQQLWVGTLNTGLDIFDISKSEMIAHFEENSGISHNSVYSILKENDSLYWIGTFGGGLNLLNVQSRKSIVITHDNINPTSISNDQIRLLKKDSKGNLWIGTQYGLNKLSAEAIESKRFHFERFFYDDSKESGEDVLVLFEDSKEQLWVGTYDSGLSVFNEKTNTFTSHKTYLPAEGRTNIIHGILEDENGYLWLSSNQGIIKYEPYQNSHLLYDESDGLVSNEFNNNACYKSKSGRMYFGGPQGLTSFHPGKINANSYAPPTVLTDLKLFNQSVKIGGEDGILDQSIYETDNISLAYDQTIFTLEFAIPNFINPAKNLYSYRLKGLEQNWNITDKNTATYTIQKAGTYIFQVKGANNDGIWSEGITELKIVVEPAPWRTWWAFLIYFLITVLALYALTNIVLSRSKLKHELDLEHVENERQKSVNQLKLRFFTNISHEFRTPLTLILGPLEQILLEYKGSNKTYKQLKVIEKNAVRLLKLINQLLDFRKFENKHEKIRAAEGNIVKFVEEIFLSFKQYAKIHNLKYKFETKEGNIPLWYDRDKMERVFYNLISNAFKYTPKGGEISLKTWQDSQSFHFEIKDTGVGLDPEHIENIFDRFYEVDNVEGTIKHKHQKGTGIGLAIAKGVVEMHAGSISAESQKGKGTTFKVSLPLGKQHFTTDQIIQDFKDSEDVTLYETESEDAVEMLSDEIGEQFIDAQVVENDKPCILVVEDNTSVRQFISSIFKNTYRVEEAGNGLEGLKLANQVVPDLIISDVMMPEMDGIEFCSRIKSNLKTSHIPLILLTARTSLIFKFEGLESGADEYIGKPFNVKELQLKARNLINTFGKIREKFAEASIIKPSEITVSSLDEELLKKAIHIVDENIANEFLDVPFFASELGVSRTVLFTKIKAWTNMTPNAFIQSMRMKRAAHLLEQGKITISQICFKVGYKDPKYFGKAFTKHHGMSPSAYAKKFTTDL